MAIIVVHNPITDPYFNIALDTWLVREAPFDAQYLMLWQNQPAVIIGRFQNTHEEVNVDFARSHEIAIVRRMSGGGAVFHDLGNLNFSMVVPTDGYSFNDYAAFTQPVIDTLAHYGVSTELSGRNDVLVNGHKFSGNAQYRTTSRLLHHGTILFDADLAMVSQILTVRPDKLHSKGIKSVRSRVTNIRPYLPGNVTLDDFRRTLLGAIAKHNGGIADHWSLNETQISAVRKLQQDRFNQWDWNFGASPPFNLLGRERFPQGELDVRLYVAHNIIEHIKIYGDFLGPIAIDPLEEALLYQPYDRSLIAALLDTFPVETYLGGVTRYQLMQVLFDMTPASCW
ncbi:MAG: lipoate--protein ligase [Firmicutes bacterium]|nr:lipoate--protein ligase [Bacillota bacterium]